MPEQHDDHIWLTVLGGAWAIKAMVRLDHQNMLVMHLWRGYEPDLAYMTVALTNYDWAAYCDAAAALLREAPP